MKALNLLLLLPTICWINPVHGQPGENIARGKKYTLDPRPNYQYCTDAGDHVQLTDGIYSKGYFWTQTSTVGWSRAHPVTITIDLEVTQPICGVSFNTAAGVAGVHWPLSLLILVSDDDKTYTYVGDLVRLSAEHSQPKTEGYSVHRFSTTKLRTHGRYVKLACGGGGTYIFVDEIEIYRGPNEFLYEPLLGRKNVDIRQFFQEQEVIQAIKRRLQNDLLDVREALESIDQKEDLEKRLAAIESEIGKLKEAPVEDFRTIFPLNHLHKRIFSVQGSIWRKKGLRRLTVWQKNRWDMLSPTEQPSGKGARIEVTMMKNEYRSEAFNLSNAGPGDVELDITIVGLPGGPNPNYIMVHEVPFTDTKSGVPIAAALPFVKKKRQYYRVEIAEGMTRQIWLTFHPQDIPDGKYSGKIIIKDIDIETPVCLNIYPFTFPDEPTLHLGGWDYTDQDNRYEVTIENRPSLIAHLRKHFVDTPWATSRVMPYGKYDQQGNMIEEPSIENFRQWISLWPNVRNYYVFAAVGSRFCNFEGPRKAGTQIDTPPFERAVSQWITWWVDTLGKWDIRPEQLGLLLVDEPHSHEQDSIIIEYARVIRKAQPSVVILEDPTWKEPWKATPELFEVSTVLCPNLSMWIGQGKRFVDFYIKQRDAGRILWFYSCSGPGKLLDPYSYHRMQHWFCWKYGARGSGFWAFGDSNGASSWNEYLSKLGAYTPVFLDKDSVTPGKHMEAIREGVEDYEYLRMLRDAIEELQSREGCPQARKEIRNNVVDSAKKLLDSAVERVISCMVEPDMMYWKKPKDRSIADQARIEVLEMLCRLKHYHETGDIIIR